MVFSGLIFLYVFLPVTLYLYYRSNDIKYRNTVLCIVSFFFYAWGEPKWVILLLLGCLADYFLGIFIEKYRENKPLARLLLIIAVIENIAVIGVFKYSGFIVENINALFGTSMTVPAFTLPIGISFFTFQKLSYTIDVYRGDVKAQKSFVYFALYISMFFQLIAGPIVRYSWIESEMTRRRTSINEISKGLKRFCFGLGKKVMLANVAGELADKFLLKAPAELTSGEAWFGIFMFALQIYYDFSGYSDMAIGLGRMFGFHFPENFKYPYAAGTVTEFWRRWHISLSTFFRDYVYIPLGGKKKHQIFNIAVVWALTGLWHGASWNYVLWGLFYGVLLVCEKFLVLKQVESLNKKIIAKCSKGASFVLRLCISVVRRCAFIFITLMGWTLFYFEDTKTLGAFVNTMFGGGSHEESLILGTVISNNILWIVFAVIMTLPVLRIVKYYALRYQRRHGKFVFVNEAVSSLCSLALLAVSTAVLVGNSYNPFLYFRY